MAQSILIPSENYDFSRKSFGGRLLDRVKNVGQSLRNMKPADVAFMATNVAVGAATKFVLVGALSAAGVTATAGVLTGLAVAMAGGAAVGATRGMISHAFGKSEGKLFSREFGRKVLLGSAISGATFGILSGGDAFLHQTEIGEKIAGKLTSVFNWFSKPAPVAAPVVAAAPAVANDDVPHCEILKKHETVLGFQLDIGPSHPDFEQVNKECEAKWGKEIAKTRMDDAPAESVAPVVEKPSTEVSVQKETPKKSGGVRKFLKAALASKETVSVPDAGHDELNRALQVTSQKELTEHYVLEQMRQSVFDTTGEAAPETATAEELATQIHPANPDAYMKGIAQQAPQLDKAHLAAVCKADIPKQFGSGDTTVNTKCDELKTSMGEQDVVIVRDINNEHEPSKKGIRVLWRGFVQAVAGRTEDVSTVDFIAKNVGGQGGVVEEMTEASRENAQLAQLAPQ